MKIDLFGIKSAKAFLIFSIVSGLALSVSKCTGYDYDKIMGLIDKVQRNFKLKNFNEDLNDNIIENEDLLKERIKNDVDWQIYNYEQWERDNYVPRMKNETILKEIEKSKYSWQQKLTVKDAVYYEFLPDQSKAQELLGPTMGIRSNWVSPDPREVKD